MTEAGRSRQLTGSSLGIADLGKRSRSQPLRGRQLCLGSVLNHVCLHQTVIGQEAIAAMEMAMAGWWSAASVAAARTSPA